MPSTNYFGMTIEALNYNWGYYGGPVEANPTIPYSVARSWDVWSPGNGQIQYLDWADLNPSAGVYNWTALNAWIGANQANNAQMVYTFGSPPAWAGGTTTNLADFQAFVTAIVTQAHGAIKYWEGFNEFNVSGIAPALLVQLQKIIYNTVHSLDPGALVLSPTVNSYGGDAQFSQFLADGGGQYFDIAAFHGYNNTTGEGIIPDVQGFQAVLSQYGLSSVPIWDTEWGMAAPVVTGTTAQEAYVSTGLILQAALGVQTEIFYAYDNANSALYNTTTGQLTAVGVAFQKTEQWLTGATLPSGYQLNGSVYTVQLTRNGESDVVAWNSAGQSSYSAGPYTQYVDVQGQVHPITGGVVTISTVPILLETPVTTSVPQAPLISSFSPDSGLAGDGITNATTLILTGTAAANSTVTVFDGTTQLGTATVNAGGVWSFTTGTLVNGAHSFTATDTNTSGNTSAASTALAVTVDKVAPAVASVVASGSGITNGTGDLNAGHVVTLTVNLSEAVTVAGGAPTLTLNDGGTATYTGGSGTNTLIFSYTVAAGQNIADLAVTAVNLNSATVTDVAGNVAVLTAAVTNPVGTLQIDTTAPAAPVISSAAPASNNAMTLIGTAEANSLVTVYNGASELGTVTANSAGTWSYTTGQLAAGSHAFTATATDAAGNVSGMSQPIDSTSAGPTVSSVVASGAGITNGTGDLNAGHVVTLTVNLSGAVTVAGGAPTLTLNDGGTATYTGGSGTNTLIFSYTVAAGQNIPDLAVTAVNLNSATVTDVAGNVAVLTAAVTNPVGTLQIDTTAPTAPIISTDAPASGNAVTLTGTAEANSTVTIYDGTLALGTVMANSAGAWSYTTGQLAAGSYAFTATATDAAGNVSAISQAIDPTVGSATVTYSANNTSLTPTVSNEIVIVSGNNDTVTLTGNNDVIQLSGSNDQLIIKGAGNSVNVTGLNDSVSSTGADIVVFSGSGGNTVVATIGSGATLNLADQLSGSGNDTLALTGNSATANLTRLAHFSGFSGVSLSGSSDTLTLTNANLTVTRLSGSGDTIKLGTGIDTLSYTNVNESTYASHDTIIGFNTSQDKIDFSAISGLNSNTQHVNVTFLTSIPKDIAAHTIDVVTIGGNTEVYANTSNSTESVKHHQQDMQIDLTGVSALNVSDFILHH